MPDKSPYWEDVPQTVPDGRSYRGSVVEDIELNGIGDLPKDSDTGASERTGTWFTSAIHNTTAIIGAGVLGLPHAMAYLTWSAGTVALVLSWITSLYTLWQLCGLHEQEDEYGNVKRFNRFYELGQYTFGRIKGLLIVVPMQIIVCTGLGIIYTVTGARSMLRVWDLYGLDPNNLSELDKIWPWILVFLGVQLVLSQLPNLSQLKAISFCAAVMSLGYSTIATAASLHNGREPGVSYAPAGSSTANQVFGSFASLGTIAFAYSGHNVVLEIAATMPSPPRTFPSYMKGVYLCYAAVTWCYFSVAFAGYWAFGSAVQDNILASVAKPQGLIATANMMVLLHVIGSYQLYSMPIYDMIETAMDHFKVPHGFRLRIVYRSVYSICVGGIAVLLPYFSDLIGFIGAFANGPSNYGLPPVMWLILKKPKPFSGHWIACWFCIVYAAIITCAGSVGGLRNIIVKASTYDVATARLPSSVVPV